MGGNSRNFATQAPGGYPIGLRNRGGIWSFRGNSGGHLNRLTMRPINENSTRSSRPGFTPTAACPRRLPAIQDVRSRRHRVASWGFTRAVETTLGAIVSDEGLDEIACPSPLRLPIGMRDRADSGLPCGDSKGQGSRVGVRLGWLGAAQPSSILNSFPSHSIASSSGAYGWPSKTL